MPESSRDYATYQWAGMLKSLRQMGVASSQSVEGMNWRSTPTSLKATNEHNTAVANLLVLRGAQIESA